MTNSFVKKYLGKQVEYHSYSPAAKYQCVDLANQFIVEVLKLDPVIGTDAKNFPSKINTNQFEVLKNTPDFIPTEGDICIWNGRVGGGAGHIAVVRDNAATVKTFNSLDQNWSKPLFVTLETHKYSNVTHFLRAKTVQSIPEPMPTKTLLQHMNVKDDAEGIQVYEQEKQFLTSARAEVTSLKTSLTEAEGRADARLNAIEDLSVILHCEPNIEAVKAATESTVKDNSEKVQAIAHLEKADRLREEEFAHKEDLLKKEIQSLRDELKELRDSINGKIDHMETKVDRADAKIEILPKPEPKVEKPFNVVEFLTSLFKRT